MPSIVDDFSDIARRANLLNGADVHQPMSVSVEGPDVHVLGDAPTIIWFGQSHSDPVAVEHEDAVVIPADYDYGC
jgi:hypothetical protein